MRADVVEPVGLNANWSQNGVCYSSVIGTSMSSTTHLSNVCAAYVTRYIVVCCCFHYC